ncbi:imidazoleglycerol-phosphate dehydratase HisB [Salinisphaera sp. USBA-960]|uniref:imidazoleglycerol-phosphate dehydratase HisB n=1 Tax=Salinisphaera orenii TaxID=856731 RepID=UPI000DBE5FE5|nr:imidazoleglycerol-phosphate dehydratase HisB [Salifodinibacter halophilus]NNC25485.1 imidazoleglycerol-phosphate dehydratase HisB [Salifodinibacter halophilus]
MTSRQTTNRRQTAETNVEITLDLDGTGALAGSTGIGFFDHMLAQIARHGLIDIELSVAGDTWVDDHHTVEDVGLVFGATLTSALGDKTGIVRYGHAIVPLDEALTRAVIDCSGRAGLYFDVTFYCDKIGTFDVELVREFFQGVARGADLTLHLDGLKGSNAHHVAETCFKAFARALRGAIAIDERRTNQTPSTKNTL